MLPELLFSVGGSMQDISRDDFSLLNGGCEKDITASALTLPLLTTSHSPIDIPPPIIIATTNSTVTGSNVNIYNACSTRILSPRPLNAISPNLDVHSIKLEDSSNNSDLYNASTPSWHHPHHSSTDIISSCNKLLLRNSDDPFISRGATSVDDDHPNELNSIVEAAAAQQAAVVTNRDLISPSIVTSTKNKTKKQTASRNTKKSRNSCGQPARTRRKSAFKLRFHHQALPAEYLSHYEETQNQMEARNAAAAAAAIKTTTTVGNNKKTQQKKIEKCVTKTHDNVRSWLQKIAEMQANAVKENNNQINCSIDEHKNRINSIELENDSVSGGKNDLNTNTNLALKLSRSSNSQNHYNQQKIVKYADLPYMGEMTLENSKPRRGRKPKKADICHLIYKNYGTIFPGTPKNLMETSGHNDDVNNNNKNNNNNSENDVTNDIYQKCKDFTSSNKINCETTNNKNNNKNDNNNIDSNKCTDQQDDKNGVEKISLLKQSLIGEDLKDSNRVGSNGEEPLNLCLRDQSESLTISSDDDDDDDGDSDDCTSTGCPTPLTTATTPETVNDLVVNLKMSLPNFQNAMLDETTSPKINSSNQITITPLSGVDNEKSPTKYWTNVNGLFIHPMALYYQKMIDSNNLSLASNLSTNNKPEILSLSKLPASSTTPPTTMPLSKSISKVEKLEKCSTPSSQKSFTSSSTSTTIASSSVSNSINKTQAPQKRKRSAIFIPPMPAENAANPATEVSICKFKFTGGAKPSLQEKKMLSVDSDGNYRYYSGTGDKSTRGYEFFPRESLQQYGVVPGLNCSGAFLNATGEKISLDLPPPSTGLSNELLQISDTTPGNIILSPSPTTSSSLSSSILTSNDQHQNYMKSSSEGSSSSDRRKRKSRRSDQREKLEQTFKDKGFLIQTQQLESAEGATYCKFRQLKKFTRYLFRSWKDYLPGDAGPVVVPVESSSTHKQQQSTVMTNQM